MSDRRLEALPKVSRWPTADEAEASVLFSPLRLGPSLAAEARTWIPAMVPWRATEEGFVTDAVVDWYARFAQGQPGVIVVEATGIRDVPSGLLLRIGHDRYVPGLRRLVDAVREASGGRTRLLIQLIDFLAIKRRPTKEAFFTRFLAVHEALRARAAEALGRPELSEADEATFRRALADAPDEVLAGILSERDVESWRQGYRERVTDLHLPHIRELPAVLPGLFADAARRAAAAGFDGVELHYAHAYTMASFLSARNTRDDGYGGSREGRLRLPLEVYRRVRQEVGDGYAVGCRFLGDEVIEGGSRVDDAVYFGVELAKAGMDFLSVSKGGKFEDARQPKEGAAAYPYTGPSGHECMPHVRIDERGPFSRNVPLAAEIRRAAREAGLETPVITAGGIATFDEAEAILRGGDADAIGSARQSLADPDWFRKVREGHGGEIRRCFFTNYCEALDQAHKEVTCQRWDRVFPEGEGEVPLARDGRRRLTAPAWLR
ncbi:NADH oxidase [Vulgatibacter incomptus]|uniref:2,4-dienoyl-CoA reductase n=1 Tax=Vulgatibacter incomptus TaxID=1391653 RepID=A0A0K1PH62_9BACT|nr:NADH oxidase [Vulgatibacter incomptus]AKU92878.1 2,4-dienoyl-CoA reductase [Vulgatibacter incomptus]